MRTFQIFQIRVEYHEQCHTHKEKVCKPTVRKVPDKVCETTYAEECVNEAHTVLETGYVDECKDIKTQVRQTFLICQFNMQHKYQKGV